jgi:hypothetical protein
MLKIKQIKTSLVGMKINASDAKRGNIIHEHFALEKWPLNFGAGADIPMYKIEIKSRRTNAVSAHTFGRMTLRNIHELDYEDSIIAEKCQYQIRVSLNSDSVVTAVEFYDFTDPYIQNLLKEGYNRVKLNAPSLDTATKHLPTYISGTQYCYAELQNKLYQMRISDEAMEKIKFMSRSLFKNIFQEL